MERLISACFQNGLYSAFFGSFVYILFGSAKDITLGPSALQSILTARFAASPIPGDATYAILLGFVGGLAQIAMSLLGLGKGRSTPFLVVEIVRQNDSPRYITLKNTTQKLTI